MSLAVYEMFIIVCMFICEETGEGHYLEMCVDQKVLLYILIIFRSLEEIHKEDFIPTLYSCVV